MLNAGYALRRRSQEPVRASERGGILQEATCNLRAEATQTRGKACPPCASVHLQSRFRTSSDRYRPRQGRFDSKRRQLLANGMRLRQCLASLETDMNSQAKDIVVTHTHHRFTPLHPSTRYTPPVHPLSSPTTPTTIQTDTGRFAVAGGGGRGRGGSAGAVGSSAGGGDRGRGRGRGRGDGRGRGSPAEGEGHGRGRSASNSTSRSAAPPTGRTASAHAGGRGAAASSAASAACGDATAAAATGGGRGDDAGFSMWDSVPEPASATAEAGPEPIASNCNLDKWTGETPSAILYGLCRKNDWWKPKFTVSEAGRGFTCKVGHHEQHGRGGPLVWEMKETLCSDIGSSWVGLGRDE